MELGWRGLAKAVVTTAAVTSAFWVILGGWLYHRHLQTDQLEQQASQGPPAPNGAPSTAAPPRTALAARQTPSDRLIMPVTGARPDQLSDNFTQARASGARQHDAIDIMAPEGTPVIAAAPGRVEKLFFSKDGGNTVYVRSGDGRTIYYYAHLRDYAPGLAEGQQVRQGAPIGSVGHSGDASPEAPHLHFAVMQTQPASRWSDRATAINPYPLLGGR